MDPGNGCKILIVVNVLSQQFGMETSVLLTHVTLEESGIVNLNLANAQIIKSG